VSINGDQPSSSSGGDGAVDRAVSTAIAYAGHVSPTENLVALKKQATEMKKAKKVLGSQIRNAKRITKRLKDKAKNLSTDDLMTLWMSKGGGKQSIAKETTTASHPEQTPVSGGTSGMKAANAACPADSQLDGMNAEDDDFGM
jgi:hypothetical protein